MHRKYANKNYKKVTPIFHPDCQKIQKGIDFSRHNRYTLELIEPDHVHQVNSNLK